MTPQPTAATLGAYAMAPKDPTLLGDFWAEVGALPIGGLELPLPAEGAGPDPAGLAARPDLRLLVTCIPTVMGRLGADPAYGLASSDDDARRRAVADVRRARDLAEDQAASDGAAVAAIQVHSAPGPRSGDRDALARSLDEILAWDLAGARVLVEHCDTLVAGQPPAKGFLTIEDELAVLADRSAAGAVGMSINWGRSAIEGRSARTPLEHLRAAADAGLLGALVLSGATDAETPWGAAWGDAHIPPRGSDPALAASADSLLGPDDVAAALALAGPGCLVAVKVAVRPLDADVATRIAVARAALALAAR
ncbi:DUF4862 family protein [Actinotalea sp. JY-7876]|uniref:DUF4862 family protein n=2 Tax=unclassified Actinotalea TaxID=2638618 RepID=UPI0015F68260|nr:DUF4862 family protein [Actinotalea sp. JY-7876]